MLNGACKSFGVISVEASSFSHSEGLGGGGGGAHKMFPPFKSGVQKCLPCLEGGMKKVAEPRFSHFVAPLPIINDQSLRVLPRETRYESSRDLTSAAPKLIRAWKSGQKQRHYIKT